MVNRIIINTILYVIFITIIVALVIGAAWGFWVMFFSWQLSEWAPLVIVATSTFWICVGGLLWLRSSIRKS